MTSTLVLLRHGQSEWNQKNLFTGWVDVPLASQGRSEASRAGALLRDAGVLPDVLHTSLLSRAIQTAHLALEAADRLWLPVRRSWRLNERHYGALQGLDKAATLAKYGEQQFARWRRGYDTPPPPIDDASEWSQRGDARYARIDGDLPRTECLRDVLLRLLPYWRQAIVPDLRDGNTVLVTAHGNSLRALIKYLEHISDADIAEVNVPTGMPLVYEIDESGAAVGAGRYLDPDAAAAGAAAVADQGKVSGSA